MDTSPVWHLMDLLDRGTVEMEVVRDEIECVAIGFLIIIIFLL